MSKRQGKLFIIVGTIGLIALTCVNWLILIGLLFLALIIWLASNDINKDSSRYTSTYSSSKVEYKEPKSPLEYSSSPHYIQQKAKHIAESIRMFVDYTISNRNGLIGSNELFSFWGVDVSAYQTLYKRHLDNLIKGLNKLGYGLVPNYQQGHKRLDFNEPCVLYKSQKNLKEIDAYMQDCVRYVATGSRTKSRFNFTYDQMKELGLETFVNRWFRFQNTNRKQ